MRQELYELAVTCAECVHAGVGGGMRGGFMESRSGISIESAIDEEREKQLAAAEARRTPQRAAQTFRCPPCLALFCSVTVCVGVRSTRPPRRWPQKRKLI